MGLQSRSIEKLLRENFAGKSPLVVELSDRKKIAADLKARLERIEGVDTKEYVWVSDAEKSRLVFSFSMADPSAYYYHSSRISLWLMLDDAGRLTFCAGRRVAPALVSDLEEVVQFVRDCKQRLERQKAQKAKRGKVRELLGQAILAHVRKLAKEQQFDFMSESDAQKLNLYVKLSDKDAVLLHIPFKEFKQFLPELGPAIVALRQLYQSGIRFRLTTVSALPRRQSWVTHQSL